MSNPATMTNAIPEGSNLGPLCFSIFINDLPQVLLHTKCTIYADDGAVYASGSSKEEVQQQLNHDLSLIQDWSNNNKIAINFDKTECMLFHPSYMNEENITIKIDNHQIKQVNKFLYLGVLLDNHLSFNLHYETVCKKVSGRIRLIARHKKFFDFTYMKIFCTSLILSIVDYSLPIWGYLCNHKIDRLDNLLMKMIECCIINRSLQFNEKWSTLESLNLLTTKERRDVYGLNLVFKHVFQKSFSNCIMTEIFPRRPITCEMLRERHSHDLD